MKTIEERVKECRKEIEDSLKKYDLAIDCATILKAGQITTVIDLIEIKKESPIIKP